MFTELPYNFCSRKKEQSISDSSQYEKYSDRTGGEEVRQEGRVDIKNRAVVNGEEKQGNENQ